MSHPMMRRWVIELDPPLNICGKPDRYAVHVARTEESARRFAADKWPGHGVVSVREESDTWNYPRLSPERWKELQESLRDLRRRMGMGS